MTKEDFQERFWGTIKVLERIAIWIGTPVLAFSFPAFSLAIVGAGILLLWITWPTVEETGGRSAQAEAPTVETKAKKERARARNSDPADHGESDEDYLARMRYSDHSAEDHRH